MQNVVKKILIITWIKALQPSKLLLIAQDEIKAELIANTSQAAEKGAFGIPTFFVGDEMFYGKDTLRELKEMAS